VDISALFELKEEMTKIGFQSEVFKNENEFQNLPEKVFNLSKEQECSIFALLIYTSAETNKLFVSSHHSTDLIEPFLRKITESPYLKELVL